MSDHPLLSLVTGHVNRHQSLERLIRSIVDHTTVSWELVISDASDDTYISDDPRIVVLEEKPRLTNTKGYNRAFRRARGQWLIYLNDDAEVTPKYDIVAIGFMKAYPSIGLGALHYCEPPDIPYHVNSAWGPNCIYANFGILHKAVGSQVGFFDDDLTMYGNDNSLTFRILIAGYGVADIPDARIIHHSVKDKTRQDNQRFRLRDNEVLLEKYWPMRDVWLATAKRLRIHNGTVPWEGGLPPNVQSMPVSRALTRIE